LEKFGREVWPIFFAEYWSKLLKIVQNRFKISQKLVKILLKNWSQLLKIGHKFEYQNMIRYCLPSVNCLWTWPQRFAAQKYKKN
jgi:hypothetical protein